MILIWLAGVDQITLGQSEKGMGTLSRLVRFRKRNLLPPSALRRTVGLGTAKAGSHQRHRNSAETTPALKRLRARSDQRRLLGSEKVLAQLAGPKKDSPESKRLLGFVS